MQTVPVRSAYQASPSTAPAFDPMLLWVAFRHHWLWVLPLGALLATGAGWIVWRSFVPQFEATHLLEVNRDYVVFRGLEDGVRDFARSERQMILNTKVLGAILSDPALTSAPSLSDPTKAEKQLRSRLNITNAGTENYLLITYRDSNPEEAARVCNAVATQYLRVREASSEKRMNDIVDLLSPTIKHWQEIVEQKRRSISDLSKASAGYDPFKPISLTDANASKLVELRQSLTNMSAEETLIAARLKSLQNSKIDPATVQPSPTDVASFVDGDKDVLRVRAKLQDRTNSMRELERKELQVINAARYERLKAEAMTLENELNRAEMLAKAKASDALAKAAMDQAIENQKKTIAELEAELANCVAKRELFSADYEAEKARVEKLGGETAELFFAKEDYERAAEMLDRLNDRRDMLKTEQKRTNGIVSISEATPPSFPVEEVPFKKIGLAAFASMLIPFALAVLIEFRNKRVVTCNNVSAISNLPVIGEIARIAAGTRYGKPSHLFEESIDALAASVLMKIEGARTIAVTSSMPAEGKSSVAAQLAISLAKICKEPVLIVDADVRLPSLHSMFQVDFGPGLTRVLRDQVSIEEAIDKSFSKLVHVLPAGKLSCNPHELLSRQNVSKFLGKIPSEYRYVIIDTAPVLPAAETLSVTSFADATLLCAMRDVSRTDHISRAQERLESSGSRTMGVVFNGVTPSQYSYRYGDYSYARLSKA